MTELKSKYNHTFYQKIEHLLTDAKYHEIISLMEPDWEDDYVLSRLCGLKTVVENVDPKILACFQLIHTGFHGRLRYIEMFEETKKRIKS